MNERSIVFDEENKYPSFNMNKDERNRYIKILKYCKDICNTENKVGEIDKCEILKMRLRKEGNVVLFNGIVTIGNEIKRENRCIDGELYASEESIMVYMHVVRLDNKKQPNEYHVSDEFKIKDNVLKRKSLYSYKNRSIIDDLNDEIRKGIMI